MVSVKFEVHFFRNQNTYCALFHAHLLSLSLCLYDSEAVTVSLSRAPQVADSGTYVRRELDPED